MFPVLPALKYERMIVFIKNPARGTKAVAILKTSVNTRDARFKENAEAMAALTAALNVERAQAALHSRWFAGRMIAAEYQFTAVYNKHFGL